MNNSTGQCKDTPIVIIDDPSSGETYAYSQTAITGKRGRRDNPIDIDSDAEASMDSFISDHDDYVEEDTAHLLKRIRLLEETLEVKSDSIAKLVEMVELLSQKIIS